MKRYGNIRFTRRVVVTLCLLVVSLSVLMPVNLVRADDVGYKRIYRVHQAGKGYEDRQKGYNQEALKNGNYMDFPDNVKVVFVTSSWKSDNTSTGTYVSHCLMFLCKGEPVSHFVMNEFHLDIGGERYYGYFDTKYTYTEYLNHDKDMMYRDSDMNIIYPSSYYEEVNQRTDLRDLVQAYIRKFAKGEIGDNVGFQAKEKSYSKIGCLDNVQMETYVTNKKELIDADENADLSKINQDKVIVYSSTSTTGIDLSKGGYKVQLYGSYAWQDKSGNIKSEDKGHKTFIKDWNAENNIKGLNRSNYTWIDWKSANNKVKADKTDNAHKPNVFEKMTTYANYQYEPIWYLRIVSLDNKYGAWVKLYNSSKKGKYTSEAVDDNDNSVSDSDGGYSKPKDTSEITGTGDTPEDAKNNVQKTEEKQDNQDIQDASGVSNSTFDKLEEFTKGIGDVPKMIADIFSFLPSWCLEVVAIGFALLIVLLVVKFIRG